MRIGLVGGIFGREPALRRNVWYTPETILLDGLRRLGHETVAISHYQPLRMKEFDVVHVHHLSFGAVRAACSMSRTPLVFTVHSTKRKETWLREEALRLVFERADAVVALSAAELGADTAAYSLKGALKRVIFNGIDADMYSFTSKLARDPCRPWSILCVAHLTPIKGHKTLLRAIARLPFHAELKLVYHGEALLDELRQIAADLGIDDRVAFLGPRNPNELRDLYQQADIFVLSSYGEALPSVITEAMLCGTPVVATDVGGVREQLADSGMIVPPQNTDALSAAIQQVIENYSFWIGRMERISRSAQERFSIETMVHRHLDLYREVIERGACRRHSMTALPVSVAVGAATNLACFLRGNPHLRKARP